MTTELTPLTETEELPSDVRADSMPYMSFAGFCNLLDRLNADGLPQVFDRSFFGEVSGSLVAQNRGTLRFFDFIDDERRPTEVLRTAVSADEPERVTILRELAEKKYSAVIALGVDATQGQLIEVFRASGLTGQTVTKAITFYMGLAEYTGLPVSPFFKRSPIRPASTHGNGTRRAASRRKKATPSVSAVTLPAVQRPVSSLEEKKTAYIDLLMRLAEQSGEKGDLQTDLLDRLERALGYETSPSKKEGD